MQIPSELPVAAAGLREQLSALVDGQAQADELADVCMAYADDPALQLDWQAYQCVGEILRQGAQAVPPASSDFVGGVMARLAQEPAQWPLATQAPPEQPMPAAANDAVFRWKLVAGLASVAAMGALVWQVALSPGETAGGQLAAAESGQSTQAVLTENGVMIRDPQLEAMLVAHRQYGDVSALQMPAGFMRNAAYDVPQR